MELLKKLYRIPSPSGKEERMKDFVKSRLALAGASFHEDPTGNIYAVKGEGKDYPCIVAHLDEVHERRKGFEIIHTQDFIFGFNRDFLIQEGIGADDKNGIWVCLKAMEKYDCMKCTFFVEEETGCYGSYRADMSFFEDCRYVLQCDRKGNSDFITCAGYTELCSSEFINAIGIERFGYREESGLMTDVVALKENGLDICCANLSCGYYNPHTNQETTRIKDLYKCFGLVCWIVENCLEVYGHTPALFHTLEEGEAEDLLIEEMLCNKDFGEKEFADFYNFYRDWYDMDYEKLHELFLGNRKPVV